MRRKKKNRWLRNFLRRIFSNKDLFLRRILLILAIAVVFFSIKYGKRIFLHKEALFYRDVQIKTEEKNLLEQFRPEAPKETYADGIHKTYYSNGALQSVFEIKNGQYDGVRKTYSEYGVLIREESYQDGNFHGVHKFYTLDGKLEKLFYYVEGKKEGKSIYYYPEGGVRTEELFKEGRLDGLTRYYYKNRHLMAEIIFSDGKPVDRKQYYSSGALWRTDAFAHKKV
ncbi:MAG TPA: hypothetical protein VD913_04315, partial [bacterium]|nr:hypothetical protein [bacterium]